MLKDRSKFSKNPGRTVVIGLESADLSLIEKWVSEGDLPFLGLLLNTCPLVMLRSPIHALQIAVWPSMLTGTSAGHHGQYVLWSQIRSGSYRLSPPIRRDSLRSYEEFLADRGIHTALADIPATVRTSDNRGVQVVDWGSEFRFGDCETKPSELYARMVREVGPYPILPFRRSGDSQADHLELARLLEEGASLKGELTRWLLQQPELEHIFSVFSEMHKSAHWFWKYMDRNHIDHEDALPRLRDAVRRVYINVDKELAAIADQLWPDDNLIVMSESGMQANYRGDHLVEQYLQALGLLVRHGPPPTPDAVVPRGAGVMGPKAGSPGWLQRLLVATKGQVPDSVKVPLKNLRDRTNIDWGRTRVFQLPTDRNTYLRINLRGREPRGCVEPGREYESLLDHLETEFGTLINGATGSAAVKDIFRMREIFPGTHAEDLPDLVVEWAADAPIDSIQSTKVGTLTLAVRELRSGNHRPEGFLLAKGPAFKKGAARVSGDILQIPATLLQAHGVQKPDQFEMGPLPILSQ